MKIKRYEGGTEAAVIEQVKNELGPQAIIVSIKTIKARGFAGIFKKPRVEIIAAYEEPGEILADKLEMEQNTGGKPHIAANPANAGAVKSSFGRPADRPPPPSDDAEAPRVNALKENQAFAAGLKDIYRDKLIEEQAEKIRLLEKNVLTAQDMLSRMSKKLSVERHASERGERRYKSNIIQVFYNTLLEQGVTEETAAAVLDGLDMDISAGNGQDNAGIDINVIVKMVYGNIISIIGKPAAAGYTQGGETSAAERLAGETQGSTGTKKGGAGNGAREDSDAAESGDAKTPQKPAGHSRSRKKKQAKPKPFIAAFIGPTGVGKTTTIAKLSADFALRKNAAVSLISADTYRIAAVEQLRTYADILNIELGVAYGPDDMRDQLSRMSATKDVILIDTAGRSHRHDENMGELRALLDAAEGSHKYLVLSLTTKFEDMLEIVETYGEITDFNIIFTKLDETRAIGSVLNLCHATGKTVSYITFGQNVPNDIRVLQPEEIARAILCGL